jgi:hypothetical protein
MKRADKTKAWLERARLVVVAARDRAAETTQSTARFDRRKQRQLKIAASRLRY